MRGASLLRVRAAPQLCCHPLPRLVSPPGSPISHLVQRRECVRLGHIGDCLTEHGPATLSRCGPRQAPAASRCPLHPFSVNCGIHTDPDAAPSTPDVRIKPSPAWPRTVTCDSQTCSSLMQLPRGDARHRASPRSLQCPSSILMSSLAILSKIHIFLLTGIPYAFRKQ